MPQAPAASAGSAAGVAAVRPAGALGPARAALEAARNAGKSQPAAPMAARAPAPAVQVPVSASVPPWEENPPPPAPEWGDFDSVPAAAQKKTELKPAADVSGDTAVVEEETPAILPPEPAAPRAQALAPKHIPSLNWDGDWPALAASLSLRGVVQQLAQQSEMLQCEDNGEGVSIHLRIPLDTLRSAGSVDKLAAALTEHFGKSTRLTTEIGAVEQTANAQAVADREARLRQAEENLQRDPFVQAMMREFGATIVPGSIKPI